MKLSIALSIGFVALAAARELANPMMVSAFKPQKRSIHRTLIKREVPQEQSHREKLLQVKEFLDLDNPDQIVDPVFGLLGAEAAAEGAGLIEDVNCLQQATADRAFTNAKAIGDVDGMVAALIYRALEKNTGAVGLKSELCTSLEAVNPEIAAIQQHQDPASENAAEENKAIALELARQIALVGGDPLLALESGTFEPGEIGDPTAAGNTCNDPEDDRGCIFTQGLLVPDATEEEILAAVADITGEAEVVEPDAEEEAEQIIDTVRDNNGNVVKIIKIVKIIG